MKDDVLTPNNSWSKTLSELRTTDKKIDIDLGDAQIKELAETPGWAKLKEYLEARVETIRDMFRGKLGEDSYELIGQKAIISDIIQDELRGLIYKVENTRKEVIRREKP